MSATAKKPKYWSCHVCHYRNESPKRKCVSCGRLKRKKRVVPHARTLRDDDYGFYQSVNAFIHEAGHGGEWQSDFCGVCGKPPSTARHHDRDHDHVTGNPRGLACPGNSGCNALMPRQMTLERARLIVAYLERVEAHYGAAT